MIVKQSISVKYSYIYIMENINSQAEIKPFKVGEVLTGNADDNPEPSRSKDQACVETRRRVCKRCNTVIDSSKYKNAIYCSITCRNAENAYRHAVKTGRIKKPGVGSGGAQLGTDNHMYKTGIGTYSEKAFEFYGRMCNRCSSTEYLVVHHNDEDRTNNDISNLEVLCKSCHQKYHETRDELGRYTKG